MKTPKVDDFKDFLLNLIRHVICARVGHVVEDMCVDVLIALAQFSVIASNCRKIVRIVEKLRVRGFFSRFIIFQVFKGTWYH